MKVPNQYQPRKKLLKQVQSKVKHLNHTGLLRMLVAIEAAEIQGLVTKKHKRSNTDCPLQDLPKGARKNG